MITPAKQNPEAALPCPPPILRIVVLISATIIFVALAFITDGANPARAQTATTDYDLDDDGLIEVRNAAQLLAIVHDLDGDGRVTVTNPANAWHTAFASAAQGAGCPTRDHDGDANTAAISSCLGYELIADIYPAQNTFINGKFTAKFVGNGFRIMNAKRNTTDSYTTALMRQLAYGATIEGVGINNFRMSGSSNDSGSHGAILERLEGTLIGSYVWNSTIQGDNSGGLVSTIATHDTDGGGLLAHSYIINSTVGDNLSGSHSGLAGVFEHARPVASKTHRSTCLNSYASVHFPQGSSRGIIGYENQSGEAVITNCVGDTTDNYPAFFTNNPTGDPHRASRTAMQAAKSYSDPATGNPFAAWDDYALDGSTSTLASSATRTDAWHFGDETNFPVLKAWGHDHTLPLDRGKSGTETVNICTRTLAVANEIIEHLNDSIVDTTQDPDPTPLSLQPCTSSSDTRNVTITQLANLVVTTPDHMFDISDESITALHYDDFEYLTNAKHFNLSDNRITTLPIRIFQGIPLKYLDLSNNRITSLHADTFAGVTDVTDIGGNALLLNGNSLTDTGLTGRIFDTLDHLNGLDLSDNSLTRINTRWFKELNDLGRKAATSPPYTHALGLHLAGNRISEHYHTNKLFTGVRTNIVSYADETMPAKAAGDVLRDAIIAASSDATNLSLSGTDFWFNAGGSTTGYQASSVTQCLTTQTAAAGRGQYIGGTEPDCQIQPHWTAPDKSAGPDGTAPTFSGETFLAGELAVHLSHTASATWAGYQLRYRVLGGGWSSWLMAPVKPETGSTSTPGVFAQSGSTYRFEVRAFSTTEPPGVATRTVTVPTRDWIPSFTAGRNPDAGTIALTWGLVPTASLPTNHSVTAYYYRYKPITETRYGSLMQVPDGSDDGALTNDETAYTITGLTTGVHYDVQLVAAIDDEDADSDFDYYTNAKQSAVYTAVPLQWPGFVRISWPAQTESTSSDARFQIRRRLAGDGTWTSWVDVPDSTDDGTHRYDETGSTITFLTPYRLYDIEVRFHDGTTPGPVVRINEARAGYQPQGLTATAGATPGSIDVSWTQNTLFSHSTIQFRVRAKLTSATDWTGATSWFYTTQGDANATSRQITGLQAGALYDIQGDFRAATWQNASYLPTVTSIRSSIVQPPTNFAATAATAAVNGIDLKWDQQTASTLAASKHQYRIKASSTASWSTETWNDIPDGGDDGTNTYDEEAFTVTEITSGTALTAGTSYDIDLRFHWNTTHGNSTTVSATATASGVPPPPNFTAETSATAFAVDLAWDTVSGAQDYQYRYKLSSGTNFIAWDRVPDSDSDGDFADEDELTVLLTAGLLYDFELRTRTSNTVQGPAATASATAQRILPPTSVAFAQGANPGEIGITWQPPASGSPTGYEFRYKLNSAAAYPTTGAGSWTDVPDADSDGDRVDERAHTITGLRGGVTYDVQLRVESATDFSVPTNDNTGTVVATPLPAPTGLAGATGDALGEIEISWTALTTTLPTGHTVANYQYSIKLDTEADSAYSAWTDIPSANTSSFTITGRTSGTLYNVRLRAAVDDADADSAADYHSLATAAASARSPVAAPTGFNAAAGTDPGEVDLTWTAQTGFGATFTAAKYQYRAKTRTAAWPTTGDLGWTDISGSTHSSASANLVITNGVQNDIQLRFVPSSTITSAAASATVTPVAVTTPSGLVATTGSSSQPNAIVLVWTAQTTTMGSEAKYQVRRKITTASWPTMAPFGWTDVADSGTDGAHNEAGVTLTGLESGGNYNIELRFHWSDAAGASTAATATQTASIVPAPGTITATPGDHQMALSWPAQSGTTGSEAKYQIRYKKTADSWPATSPFGWADIPSSTHSTTSYTVTGLDGGDPYEFQIRFHWNDATGASQPTSVTATPTEIAAPANLTAVPSATPRQMIVSWDAQTAQTASNAKFQIRYRAKEPTGNWVSWINVPDSSDTDSHTYDETTHTLTGLVPYREYDVEARMQVGTTGGTVASVIDARAGYQPRNFAGAPGGAPGSIKLTWDEQSVFTGPNSRFATRIKLATTASYPGTWNYIGTAGQPSGYGATEYTYTGLTAGTSYDIHISFRDAVAWPNAGYTPAVRVTSGVVQPPKNFTASTPTDAANAVTLSWDQQTDSTLAASHYEYRIRESTATDWTGINWNDVSDSSDANSHTYDENTVNVYSLTEGTSYYIELRFHWNSTYGDSETVSATATASGIPAPTNFTAGAGTAPGSVDLSWDAVGGINDLQYRFKLKTAGTYPATGTGAWTTIPDSNDAGSSAGDEVAVTVTGLTAGSEYDFELRARVSATEFSTGATADATAQTQAAPQTFTVAGGTAVGSLTVTFTAPGAGTPTQYDYRYKRASETNYPATWTQVPDVNNNNNRVDDLTFTISSLWAGVSYNVQLTVTSSVGTSQPSTVTQTATAQPAPASFTATIGDAPGEIDLAWTAISTGLPTGDTVVNYQYRSKLNTATVYGDWTNIPASSTSSHTVTGLTAYTAYDIQLRAAIDDGGDAGTVADYHSSAATAANTRSGLASPATLYATAGTNPGEVDLTWNAQTTFGATYTTATYQVRSKLTANTWPAASPYGWADISGSDRSTASHTVTGLMASQLHDIQVRFLPDSSLTSGPASIQGTPTAVPTPAGFDADSSANTPAAIDLTWTAQTASTSSEAKYQYRRKLTSGAWPGTSPFGWTDIPDGSDSDSNAYNEAAATVSGLTSGSSYDVELRFHWSDAIGASAATSATATASAVPAPGNFAATAGTAPGSVDLSWDLVNGINDLQYRFKLKSAATYPTTGTGSWTTISDSNDMGTDAGDETAVTVTGLTGGTEYSFELRARVSATDVSPSVTADGTAQTQPPPQNAAFTFGTNPGEINVQFDAPASGTPTGYSYRFKFTTDTAYPATWTQVPDVNNNNNRVDDRNFDITSLWAGVRYNVQIRADSAIGSSQPGMSTTGTVFARGVNAPSGFSASRGVNPGEIAFSWTAHPASSLPSGDTVVNYQYRTKLSSAGASTFTAWTNMPTANTSSFTVTGLSSYTEYDVQIRAAIDDGDDAGTVADYYSGTAGATNIRSGLAIPASLRATGGTNPGEVALTWTAQTTFDSTFTAAKYQLRTKLATANWPAGGGWADIANTDETTAAHTITNLLNRQQYDIQVRFVPSSTLTSAAASVQGTPTAVATPVGLTAATSPTTAGAINLTWTPQSAITVSTATYQYRTKLTSASWTGVTWTAIPDSTADADTDAHNEQAYVITGLNADAQYNIQLRFFMSTAIGGSAEASATATASRVPVPTNFNATTGSGAGTIDLSWTAITGATDYQYRCQPAGTNCTTTWQSAGTGTSHTVTNLSGGVFYNLQLRARVTGIGESAPTSSQRAQAQTTPGPATLTFSQGTNPGDIKIDWTAPTSGSVTHYEYRYKLASAPDSAYPSAYTMVPDSDSDSDLTDETTVTITGLQAGVSYHVQFRVYASQAVGHSLPQRGTQASRPVPPPTSFRAAGGTNPGTVNLSWQAPAGVTIQSYDLRHRQGTTGDWSSWTSAGTATTYTYTGLRADVLRTFQLRATMQTVGSSTPVAITGTPTPVPTPAGFTADTGVFPGEIDLSWQAVTSATSYEYRFRLGTLTQWPEDTEWHPASGTTASVPMLSEGVAYLIELRAAITAVGTSTAASSTATARDGDIMDAPDAPAPTGFSVSAPAGTVSIAITHPTGSPTFIYRYRQKSTETTTAGQQEPGTARQQHENPWSPWFKVTPASTATQHLIEGLTVGAIYEVEVRAYTTATGFTTAHDGEAQIIPLDAPLDFKAEPMAGVILLTWKSPKLYHPQGYDYRTRPTGTTDWGDWVTVPHEGTVHESTQRRYVGGLEPGISHDFELRIRTQAGAADKTTQASAITRVRLAEVERIAPVVREVTIRAGTTVALTVDIYDTQDVLDNSIPESQTSKLTFQWSEQDSAGGSFGTPNNERRVTYTAPNTPGRYTVQAEAKPLGICKGHHETPAKTDDCIATFTIRVSAAPTVAPPRPDPINPTGSIPTTLTDSEGTSYAVVTPAEGGTFQGQDITITTPAGAVPDRTVLGITAAKSDIVPPTPIPGATISVAGSFYDIQAIRESGDPPLPSFTLTTPARACLPFPDAFRADLSNVAMIQRTPDGNLTTLSTTIRSRSGTITVCGTLSRLPATIGVARIGLVPTQQTTPESTQAPETPDTGATAPALPALLILLLLGALIVTLTATSKTSRITSAQRNR